MPPVPMLWFRFLERSGDVAAITSRRRPPLPARSRLDRARGDTRQTARFQRHRSRRLRLSPRLLPSKKPSGRRRASTVRARTTEAR